MERKQRKSVLDLERKWLASFPKFNRNPIVELNDSGEVIFANPAAKKIIKELGLEINPNFFVPRDIGIILRKLNRNKNQRFYREVSIKGSVFSEYIQMVPEFETIRIYAVDITKRILAEQALKNLNLELEERVYRRTEDLNRNIRALKMLSACNVVLVRAKEEKKLLEDICRIIVHTGGYKMAWVGGAEHDRKKSVLPIAQVGFEDGYLEKANISWSKETSRGRGPTGKAISEDTIQIGRYLSSDSSLSPWRKEALKRGYSSSIALPLKIRATILGALMVYSADPEAFDKKEVALLKEFADDLAFGILNLRIKKERDENKKYLEISNRLLKMSNNSVSRKIYLDSVIKYIRKISACNYGGIRILDKEGLIPYDSYFGFSNDFWKSENMLSIKKDQCACIRVIAGKPDPQDLSAMTKFGSFYTNNSLGFVSALSEKEQERFRGKCVRCGFSSIAIIPIRSKGRIIGAIHLADKKLDKLPLKKIELIESLTSLVGEGIEKFNASDKLQEKERSYRELVQYASSIIVRLDSKGNIIFLNEFAQKLFGYKKEEVIGHHVVGTIIPKTESSGRDLEAMMKDIIKNPQKYAKNENENLKKNGERIWVSWHNRAIFGANGKLKGILSVGDDITERKQREERLVESYKYLGVVNRKISFLLELDQLAYQHKGQKVIIAERILGPLNVFSSANFGALFTCENKIPHLISSVGMEKNEVQAVREMPGDFCETLRVLFKNKALLYGFSGEFNLGKLRLSKRAKYFLFIPINLRNKMQAFIFLGFQNEKNFSAQELEFFEIFSTHVAVSLANAGILK